MHFIRPSVAFSLALALAACAKADEHRADTTAITTTSTDSTSTTTTAPLTTTPSTSSTGSTQQPQPPAGTPTPAPVWTVTERGIGNLRAGMTVAELRAAVPAFSVPASRDSTACTYAKTNDLAPGVMVMMEGGKVVRVEVRRGATATSAGARIGDSEDKIKALYPGQVSVSPHKYTTGGHYLTVVPPSSADGAYRIIFETDGKRVVNYRAGLKPQVEYVEGCG
jgi:hypothetical protein